jgi:hypothetical protein
MRSLLAMLLAVGLVACDAAPCRTALKLDSEAGRLSARFTIDDAEPGPGWTVVVVHEGHVAWRGRGHRGPFRFDDYDGADHVSIRAMGPDGRICTAEATLAASN